MSESVTIRLMWNTANFADTVLPSDVTTLGHLKTHLGDVPNNASVNLNGTVVSDDTVSLEDGDLVSIVSKDKTGG